MTDTRPCKGDAFASVKEPDWWGYTCRNCRNHWRRNSEQRCLGSDGWEFMARAAAEVAAERGGDLGALQSYIWLYQ